MRGRVPDVGHRDVLAGFAQGADDVGSDETGAAGHKHMSHRADARAGRPRIVRGRVAP
ncbi:hypothetical protein Aab01nite_62440 [Paractinoplanes abujensis]|nr:hypothetical protein Aab01nite_62440 [Actinoplanes abujensis]